jgi:uncharacterized alkaline shock family protein YloU
MKRNKYLIIYGLNGHPINNRWYSYVDVVPVNYGDDAKKIFGLIMQGVKSDIKKTLNIEVEDMDVVIDVISLLDSSVKA